MRYLLAIMKKKLLLSNAFNYVLINSVLVVKYTQVYFTQHEMYVGRLHELLLIRGYYMPRFILLSVLHDGEHYCASATVREHYCSARAIMLSDGRTRAIMLAIVQFEQQHGSRHVIILLLLPNRPN
jgi:hypothetical protein